MSTLMYAYRPMSTMIYTYRPMRTLIYAFRPMSTLIYVYRPTSATVSQAGPGPGCRVLVLVVAKPLCVPGSRTLKTVRAAPCNPDMDIAS